MRRRPIGINPVGPIQHVELGYGLLLDVAGDGIGLVQRFQHLALLGQIRDLR